MNNGISYIITGDMLTLVLDGKQYSINRSDIAFKSIVEELKSPQPDLAKLETLLSSYNAALHSAVTNYTDGEVEFDGTNLTYGGKSLEGYDVDRLKEFCAEGLPWKPLAAFIGRMQQNPSQRARREGYKFLEHRKMPLTEDGCFLAYKGVNMDYKDKYTGRFDNSVGNTLTMKRAEVDDDCERGCSNGFHAGTLEYASGYAGGSGRIVIVKISPEDIVSVPLDCGCQKLRTCRYEVVADYTGPLPDTCVTSTDEGYREYRCGDDGEKTEDSVCDRQGSILAVGDLVFLDRMTFGTIVRIDYDTGEALVEWGNGTRSWENACDIELE